MNQETIAMMKMLIAVQLTAKVSKVSFTVRDAWVWYEHYGKGISISLTEDGYVRTRFEVFPSTLHNVSCRIILSNDLFFWIT
jgi:hypothetical protein